MCERDEQESRKGQTEGRFYIFLPQTTKVWMDLGKLLNDPTQEVIHRRLSNDIGLIWREEWSRCRLALFPSTDKGMVGYCQRFVWVKFWREWVYTLRARVLTRNGQALQKYIASIRASVDFRANWPTEPLPDARLMCSLWGLDVKEELSTILTIRYIYSLDYSFAGRIRQQQKCNYSTWKGWDQKKNWQNLPMCQAVLVKPGLACTAIVETLTHAGVGPA